MIVEKRVSKTEAVGSNVTIRPAAALLTCVIRRAFFCAHWRGNFPGCRVLEEELAGFSIKEINRPVIEAIKPLLHRGNESLPDVLAWLESEQKRSGQGPKPRGR